VHLYPWWFNYAFDNPVRRLFQKPERMLAPYLGEGMTALDLGCGMGFFSVEMARLVGPSGRVIAVDLRPRVLGVLMGRAERAGVQNRIRTHECEVGALGLRDEVDFGLVFWMSHEVRDRAGLARELRVGLKPGGKLLVAEPKLHVPSKVFRAVLDAFEAAGMRLVERPRVGLSMAALLEKK